MKFIIAPILLLAILAQTFSRFFIVVDYYANSSAFAKNCENKAKPVMRCNGKCQLMKKLQKEEQKDQQNPERKTAFKNDVISSRSFFSAFYITSVSLSQIHGTTTHPPGRSVDRSMEIFHPPQT